MVRRLSILPLLPLPRFPRGGGGRARGFLLAAWATLLLPCVAPLEGQDRPPIPGAAAVHPPLEITVVDGRTGRPVAAARIVLAGGASRVTDPSGRAVFPPSPPEAEVEVSRYGYRSWSGIPEVSMADHGEMLHRALIRLEPLPVVLEGVEVRSRALGMGPSLQASAVVGPRELAERMAPSVAAAIAFEPGVTARTNGPMASQPVIRGLGGDRVLVLEDGLRTGDVATTAPDHAVTVEPSSARRIEVIRGPAGLLYGSNTLGGVVNVVRDDVPRTLPEGVEWAMAAYGESVNRGGSASGRVAGARGGLVLQADASGRIAGDIRTPGGIPLPFTDLDGFDVGAGASLVRGRGHAGVAIREIRSFYGVPSSFDGVTLPGAHDGGIYIDLERRTARFDAEWRPASGPVEALALGGNAVRFLQEEFELGGFVGTRFGQLAGSGEAVLRLRGERHRGAVGVAGQWRDLRAEGSFTGTRPAVQRGAALFALDEFTSGRWTVLAGLRADRVLVSPLDSTETLLLRDVRSRQFGALTGALGVRRQTGRGWSLSLQVARAFRPPSIEELYSAGPHLANYAYEVGLPSLDAERGLGIDAVIRRLGERSAVEVAAYAMEVEGYVVFAPQVDPSTGLPMRDPRLRRYVVYRPRQTDARLLGVEVRSTLLPAEGWTLLVAGDLPRGTARDGTPLPSMPPPTLRADLRRRMGAAGAGVDVEIRGRQSRVPPPPPAADVGCRVAVVEGEAQGLPAEYCPTPGALLLGALFSWDFAAGGVFRHPVKLTLTADNLLDTRWRDPLWRAKEVAPQPGRNLRLAVQVMP